MTSQIRSRTSALEAFAELSWSEVVFRSCAAAAADLPAVCGLDRAELAELEQPQDRQVAEVNC